MKLLKKLKRFEVKYLFVCKIFAADNIRCKPYLGMFGVYDSLWTQRFLDIKILYGNDKILKDPVYGTEYVNTVNALHPEKNLYYQKLGNITDIFEVPTIFKRKRIPLTKIEELNSILKEEFKNQRVAT